MHIQNSKVKKEKIAKAQKAQIKRCCPNAGFSVEPDGVYFNDKKISNSHFVVNSFSKCVNDGSFYATFIYDCIDSTSVSITLGREELVGQNLAKMLVAKGFDLCPNGDRALTQLLTSQAPKSKKPLALLSSNGWYVTPEGNLAYSFGSKIIARPEDKKGLVRYTNTKSSSFSTSGSLADWQKNVANQVMDNCLIEFALALSFASLLLKFSPQTPGYAVNLTGRSSRGKTSCLQVAASPFGDASETGHNSRINKAHSTVNGMESMFTENNDSLLVFDELGMSPKLLEKLPYLLSGGKGKNRLTVNLTKAKQFVWRLLMLSSGEVKVSDVINKMTNGEAKAGQLLRFIDIPIGNGTISNTHSPDVSKAEFANQLKSSVSKYYGTAGVEFIKYLVENYTAKELTEEVQKAQEYYTELILENVPVSKPELRRVASQLALVPVGAEMASQAGVLGYKMDANNCYPAIESFIIKTFKQFRSEGELISDKERGIISLRNFLLSNQNLFTKSGCKHGFRHKLPTGSEVFAIYKHEFNDITGQPASYKAICTLLHKKGLLHKNNQNRPVAVFKHKGNRTPVYAISPKILELDDNLQPITKKNKLDKK